MDGFDTDPMLRMPHKPPAYASFIEAAGYRKAKDLFAWLYDHDREVPPVIERRAGGVTPALVRSSSPGPRVSKGIAVPLSQNGVGSIAWGVPHRLAQELGKWADTQPGGSALHGLGLGVSE